MHTVVKMQYTLYFPLSVSWIDYIGIANYTISPQSQSITHTCTSHTCTSIHNFNLYSNVEYVQGNCFVKVSIFLTVLCTVYMQHPQEEKYKFATPSTMKPTQIRCSEGSVNQIPAWVEVKGLQNNVDVRMLLNTCYLLKLSYLSLRSHDTH